MGYRPQCRQELDTTEQQQHNRSSQFSEQFNTVLTHRPITSSQNNMLPTHDTKKKASWASSWSLKWKRSEEKRKEAKNIHWHLESQTGLVKEHPNSQCLGMCCSMPTSAQHTAKQVSTQTWTKNWTPQGPPGCSYYDPTIVLITSYISYHLPISQYLKHTIDL